MALEKCKQRMKKAISSFSIFITVKEAVWVKKGQRVGLKSTTGDKADFTELM